MNKENKLKLHLNMSQIIAIGYIGIILVGAILLTLPFVNRDGEAPAFLISLFTATSAVCVTGLSLVDVWTQWNLAGQIILLTLIEIGGLGFMSLISMGFYIVSRKIKVTSLSLLAESLGSDNLKSITRIHKRLIVGSLGMEAIGAVILCIHFLPDYGFGKALWMGLFHSVSSFCNAGFDVMGFIEPGSSLMAFATDPVVCITLSLLVILGGLGFFVWDDLVNSFRPRKWSVYTKMVLETSAVLIVIGFVLFFALEYNNPGTFGNLTLPQKILAAFFQSVSPRTAGFAAIGQDRFTDAGKLITIILMMVGGSSGSTAGGIKTVTFLIFIRYIFARLRGKKTLLIHNRKINDSQIQNALTLVGAFIIFCSLGALIVNITSSVPLGDAVFECVSALATVGLSFGITGELSLISQIIIMLFMFLGRVGILTISLGFFKSKSKKNTFEYPDVNLMIG